MTAARTHAQRFVGLGAAPRAVWCLQCERRVAGGCKSPFCKVLPTTTPIASLASVSPPKPASAPAPAVIGNGPCAPRRFPYLDHRTQAEIMAAEARG